MAHRILRHFEIADLQAIAAGADYGTYDGFVYHGHPTTGSAEMATVAALVAAGKLAWRYFSIADFGPSTFTGEWFDWWQDTAQAVSGWNARVYDAGGDVGMYYASYSGDPANEARGWVDWRQITVGLRRTAVVDKMFELAPGSGIFFDVGWLIPDTAADEWLFKPAWDGTKWLDRLGSHSAGHAALVSNNPSWGTDHSASIRAFVDEAQARALLDGRYCITNGETRTRDGQAFTRPMYYENSARTTLYPGTPWESSVAGWQAHEQNVLSIIIDASSATELATMLAQWLVDGGWVAFTGGAASSALLMDAYAQAAEVRRIAMALRASAAEVKEIIDTALSEAAVGPFLTVANLLVDRVEAAITSAGWEAYSAALLKEIERWLAAHFVAVRDPRISMSVVGAGQTRYHGQSKIRLDHTPYGQQVMLLDHYGVLSQMSESQRPFELKTIA